jgi:carboxylesterase type B
MALDSPIRKTWSWLYLRELKSSYIFKALANLALSYRVGIFGFPDGPGFPDQNLGILDVRKALEWVRDNIANFGGDASKIMMFGQSAGSMLLDMYSMAYPQDPIVSAIIGESGSANSGFALDNKNAKWNSVARSVGCSSGQASVECMRKKTEAEITKAVGNAGRSGVAGPFAPVVDSKVVWSRSGTIARQRQGLFAKVPYVFMVNSREMGVGDGPTFNCPANAAASARVQHSVPAWRVRFYGGGSTGHGAELPFVFGSKAGALSDYVMDTWAGFSKDPQNYLQKQNWPLYKPGGQIVAIGKGADTKAALEAASVVESGCGGF